MYEYGYIGNVRKFTILMYNEIIVIDVLYMYNNKQPTFTWGGPTFYGGGGRPPGPPAGYAPVLVLLAFANL